MCDVFWVVGRLACCPASADESGPTSYPVDLKGFSTKPLTAPYSWPHGPLYKARRIKPQPLRQLHQRFL
jgi:hypothetical protein